GAGSVAVRHGLRSADARRLHDPPCPRRLRALPGGCDAAARGATAALAAHFTHRDTRAVGRAARRRGLPLGLGLELGVVFPEERLDLVAHREQLRPLLLVERHRKAAEPVDRDAAFLAHLEADAAPALRLEPLVLGPELFEFRPEIFFCHVAVART